MDTHPPPEPMPQPPPKKRCAAPPRLQAVDRGTPTIEPGAWSAREEGLYLARAWAKREAMHRYAERVDSLRERPALDRTGQCPKYRLTQAARATTHEKESFLKAVVSEKGAFAQALNRRGARAFGLQPEESWDIETEDGLLRVRVLRNALQGIEASAFGAMRACHDAISNGWFLTCEADAVPQLQRVKALMGTTAGAAAMRVVEGFVVHRFGARGGDVKNGLTVTYSNPKGAKST